MKERDIDWPTAFSHPDASSVSPQSPPGDATRGDPVAVVPARDEAARLPRALAALRRSGVAAIVVANGCSEETADVALAYGACVIETPRLAGGVGEARAIGMRETLVRNPRWVLTTDSDCTLGSETVETIENALTRADAVLGRVVLHAREFATLPGAMQLHGVLEQRHQDLLAEIEAHVRSTPWNPAPCHHQSPEALIAFRQEAYRAAGGFLPIPWHEDRAMADALVHAGARIARPFDALVHASCWLVGRATGGMASTIEARTRTDLDDAIATLLDACAAAELRLAELFRRDAPQTVTNATQGVRHGLPLLQAPV